MSLEGFQNYTGASQIPIEKGDLVVLRCEVEGNPLPNVTWTKTSPSSQIVQLASGYELRLWNVTMPDVGEYRCRAENTEGFDSATFRLSYAGK